MHWSVSYPEAWFVMPRLWVALKMTFFALYWPFSGFDSLVLCL